MRNIKRIMIATIISIILLLILFQFTNTSQILELTSRLSLKTVIIALAFYTSTYFFRAWRSFLLLNKKISFTTLFHITSVHEMLAQIIPLRLGELTFITLTKKTGKISTHNAISTYLVFRCLDILTLVAIFLIATTFQTKIVSTAFKLTTLTIGITLTALFLSLWHRPNQMVRLMNNIILPKRTRLKTILHHITNILKAFHSIKKNTSLMSVTILSFLTWFIQSYLLVFILTKLHVCITFHNIALATGIIGLSAIIPVPSIAGIGTIDSAWSVFLIALGIEKSMAVSTSLVLHIIAIIFYTFLGCLSAFCLRKKILDY